MNTSIRTIFSATFFILSAFSATAQDLNDAASRLGLDPAQGLQLLMEFQQSGQQPTVDNVTNFLNSKGHRVNAQQVRNFGGNMLIDANVPATIQPSDLENASQSRYPSPPGREYRREPEPASYYPPARQAQTWYQPSYAQPRSWYAGNPYQTYCNQPSYCPPPRYNYGYNYPPRRNYYGSYDSYTINAAEREFWALRRLERLVDDHDETTYLKPARDAAWIVVSKLRGGVGLGHPDVIKASKALKEAKERLFANVKIFSEGDDAFEIYQNLDDYSSSPYYGSTGDSWYP